jgi:hypothetical protein
MRLGRKRCCPLSGVDAALRQHLLDIADAEGEPDAGLNGQPEDARPKTEAPEGDWLHGHSSVGRVVLPRNGDCLELS